MQPWIILGVVALVVYILIPNTAVYVCPKCGKAFVPKKIQLLGIHSLGKRLLKCPHCGHRGMMGTKNDAQ